MSLDYEKAKRMGEKAYRKALLSGKYPYLPALEDFLGDDREKAVISAGVREIPLRLVAGTKTRGRQEAFADNFMPLLDQDSEFAAKWDKLFEAQMTEGIREPVKAYEYMCKFYILEGNKRVSVMKYVDSPFILADVMRIMPPKKDDKDVRVYYEFDEFFRSTGLYDIVLSEEGGYRKLEEIFGMDQGSVWPEEKILELKHVYEIFSEAYSGRGGRLHPDAYGDVFLLYITLFGVSSLTEDTLAQIGKNLDRIQQELWINENRKNVDFQEEPREMESAGSIFTMWKKQTIYSEKNPLHIAFLYDGTPDLSSWIYGHELGRNHIEEAFPGQVLTKAWSNVNADEKFQEAVKEAAEDRTKMIITTSPSQMEMALRAAVTYPDIRFMNCSVNLSHNMVRTYYGRMHEAKFLMGILAGSLAKDHKIGYVADYPIYGALARINAFAIGAAMVDPKVRIFLTWTSLKDGDWLEFMNSRGIRTISGPDLIKPVHTSRDYGLYQINDDRSVTNLAMPVWDWGKYYERIVQSVMNGSFDKEASEKKDQVLNYWWGMSAGVIDVILSGHLSYYSQKLVETFKQGIINDTFRPFDGELRGQDGEVILEAGKTLGNDEIVRMSWLNDNVEGYVPAMEELTEAGKQAVLIGGMGVT